MLNEKHLRPKPPQEEVEVTVSQKTLALKVGGDKQLTATVKPTGKTVAWSSTKPAVATVKSDGAVTAVSAGVTDVVATVEGKEAICKVTVTEPDTEG